MAKENKKVLMDIKTICAISDMLTVGKKDKSLMKCKNCNWWDKEEIINDETYGIGKRPCLNPKIFITGDRPNGYSEYSIDPDKIEQEKREKESLAAACDCSGLAHFITAPDFGCNLFELKS